MEHIDECGKDDCIFCAIVPESKRKKEEIIARLKKNTKWELKGIG